VHVGGHDDARLPSVALQQRGERCGLRAQEKRTGVDSDSGVADLAVQDHHVVGVRGQPGLHGFTDGTDAVEGRGVAVGPAVVLHLQRRATNALNNTTTTTTIIITLVLEV